MQLHVQFKRQEIRLQTNGNLVVFWRRRRTHNAHIRLTERNSIESKISCIYSVRVWWFFFVCWGEWLFWEHLTWERIDLSIRFFKNLFLWKESTSEAEKNFHWLLSSENVLLWHCSVLCRYIDRWVGSALMVYLHKLRSKCVFEENKFPSCMTYSVFGGLCFVTMKNGMT